MPRTADQLAAAAAAAEEWLDTLDPDVTPAEDADDLRAIGDALTDVSAADRRLRDAVAGARARGRSWGMIALVLGVSKQAARERFQHDALSGASEASVRLAAVRDDPASKPRRTPSTTAGGGSMAHRHGPRRGTPAIAVEPRSTGKWAVQKDGTKRASRVVDTKAEAERIARAQARRQGAELVIKGKDGQIQRNDSHGRDGPNRPG